MFLLVLAIAASGFLHIGDGSGASVAAAHSHDRVSVVDRAGGDRHASDHDRQPHGTICSPTGTCSFYLPVNSAGILFRIVGTPTYVGPEADHPGLAPIPHARPPKLFANV